MTPEQKKKLRNVAVFGLLTLIGGTFAFQSFNQRVTNDREGWNNEGAAGRIHDYYNAGTGNKDIFVENYGDEPLLVRVQLREFLPKNGESIVKEAEREHLNTWTVWKPAADDIHNRLDSSPSQVFDRYADWSFGFSRQGDIPVEMSSRNLGSRDRVGFPYMPTFNHDREDERTAAAGDAQDYVDGGVTHPGDGTEGYWRHLQLLRRAGFFQNFDPAEAEKDEADRTPLFPGRPIMQEVKHTVAEEHPPMTLTQWEGLKEHEKVGRYWVVDEESGYAYWASYLQPGQATSYLIDQTDMAEAIKEEPGSWFYSILVQGNMVSPTETNINSFFEKGGDTPRARDLVERMGLTDIPNFNGDIDPGESFHVEGAEYEYVGPHGGGGHLVVPRHSLGVSSFGATADYQTSNVKGITDSFYASLPQRFQARVLPVSYGLDRALEVAELEDPWSNPLGKTPHDYFTTVDESGEKTAFVMSIADIMFGTRGVSEMKRGNQETLTAGALDHPFDFNDFWTRTAVGGANDRVFGWDLTGMSVNNWRSWDVSEIKPILPALLLSQVGENQNVLQ
ncbi:hypothetical protein AALA52_08830 [Lactococcus ileimucosae]|uniref:Uncharacterized protein n=1 Tax=Lactococcus ileimucosae TaxID=2941329 RepID=A0ABV4D478_9LACT